MNVLFLVTDAYGANGGIAKVNRDIIGALRSWDELGNLVVLPRNQNQSHHNIPNGVSYVERAASSKLAYVRELLRIVTDRPKFDLVLCGHTHLVPFAAFAAKRCRVSLGLVVHGIEAWKPTSHGMANRMMKQVDWFVAVSAFTRDRFLSWSGLSPADAHVIPNCVDLERFTPGPKNAALAKRLRLNGKRVVMTLGRLAGESRAKGFDKVLEAMPEFVEEDPAIVYLIAGDGPDRERLKLKAAELGIADHVVLSGFVAEEDKVDLYRLADVFAMPSQGEGFGIVLLEAMACGVPVIASSADASREAVLNGKLGAVVDPDDPAALTAALRAALTNGRRADRAALAGFGVAAFRTRWGDLLREKALKTRLVSAPVTDRAKTASAHA